MGYEFWDEYEYKCHHPFNSLYGIHTIRAMPDKTDADSFQFPLWDTYL